MNQTILRALMASFLAATLQSCNGCGNGRHGTDDPAGDRPVPAIWGDAGVEIETPTGADAQGIVTISFTLRNSKDEPLSVLVEYSPDGGTTFHPATSAPQQETNGLSATALGSPHAFRWNALMDGVGIGAPNPLTRVRISPREEIAGLPATSGNFTVHIEDSKPSITWPTWGGIFEVANFTDGIVAIDYVLKDAESHWCRLAKTEYSLNGVDFLPATPGPGGDGTSDLSATPAGVGHRFVWNAYQDLGATDATVWIRLTATDGLLSDTAAIQSAVQLSTLKSGSSIWSDPPTWNLVQNADDQPRAAATDGRSLYVAGYGGTTWALDKTDLYSGNMDLDFFSTVESLTSVAGQATSLAIGEPWMYLLGIEESPLPTGDRVLRWRIEKRALGTGQLHTSITIDPPVATLNSPMPSHFAKDLAHLHVSVDSRFVYLAGTELADASTGTFTLRLEKRKRSDLSLVPSFGMEGRIVAVSTDGGNAIPHMHELRSLVIDGACVYGAGIGKTTDWDPGKARIEKRRLSDGALAVDFGSGGVASDLPTLNPCTSLALAVNGGELHLFGCSNGRWRFEKLNATTGVPSGVSATSVSTPDLYGSAALVTHVDVLYAAGIEGASPDTQWRVERRNLTNLALLPGFGPAQDGVVKINPGSGNDFPVSMVLSGGVLFIAGSHQDFWGDLRWRIEARLQ